VPKKASFAVTFKRAKSGKPINHRRR
jgi:hypothetical protein